MKLFFVSAIYHQITRFIQGYIDNEVNMNAEKSCKQSCSDYTNTKSFDCAEKTLCSEYAHIDEASTRCKGTIYNCDFVDDDVTVCPVIRHYILLSYHSHHQVGNINLNL